jgi:hypothetical protein
MNDSRKTKFAIFLLALVAIGLASFGQSGDYNRRYSFVEDLSKFPFPKAIDFYTGERVELTIQLTRNGDPINLSTGTYVSLWGILDRSTSPAAVVKSTTGVVVNAASGMIQFTIMPTNNNIIPSSYDGYVTVMRMSNSVVVDRGTVQSQSVNVRQSSQ